MRWIAVAAGCAVLVLVWAGPLLDTYIRSFSAHMLAHMGVVAVAAPMISGGLAGTRFDPSGRHPALFAPLPASFLELVVVWGWHAPAMRALAETSTLALVAEQASFLLVGLLLWLSCLGFDPATKRQRGAAGVIGLLFTSVHMTLLGALLALTPRPLYGDGPVTCLGITLRAEQDQQLGGIAMLLLGAAVYLAGGLFLMARILNAPDRARGLPE